MGRPGGSAGVVGVLGLVCALGGGALVACDGGAGAGADVGADTGPDAAAAVRDLGQPEARLGYLYAECPWQAFPALPEVGPGCFLDVFLLAGPATGGEPPPECAGGPEGGAPLTSRCLLDALGVTIDPAAAVRLVGAPGVARVCTRAQKTGPETCAGGAVFAPTEVAAALAEGAWELRVDRALDSEHRPDLPHDPLDEGDYVPSATGHTLVVRIPADGATVRITADCEEGAAAAGERVAGAAGTIHYDLGAGLMAGGRFLFWLAEDGSVQAEYTIYGSGLPVVSSERGPLVPAPCPAE